MDAGQQIRAVDGNGYGGHMSAEAAGINATLFALSSLSFKYPDAQILAERFHQLRAFALDHSEASAILAAID
ncbi:MAG: antirestriction protein [Acetobacteraceae bacterium]